VGRKILFGILASGIPLLAACSGDPTNTEGSSPSPTSSVLNTPSELAGERSTTPEKNVDWLNKKSIINAAPKIDDDFASSIFQFGVGISQIDVCNLVDKISFYGEDKFRVEKGNVPANLKKFAIVSGHGQYIMFSDGSLMGNGSTETETLADYLKGFPDKWSFWQQRFYSLDFSKLPDQVRNGFIKIQSVYLDQKRDGAEDSETIYEQRGDHTLIVVEADGKIETYMPRVNLNRDKFLPDMNIPSYYDTKYISSEKDQSDFWVGVCTTTHYEE
jgi:hypothetical protein